VDNGFGAEREFRKRGVPSGLAGATTSAKIASEFRSATSIPSSGKTQPFSASLSQLQEDHSRFRWLLLCAISNKSAAVVKRTPAVHEPGYVLRSGRHRLEGRFDT
jgi:hypothetical protein